MGQETHKIALVGAGEQGRAILAALLRVPGVAVCCVFDTDPGAAGIALAAKHGIRCHAGDQLDELAGQEIDVILETSGDPEVAAAVEAARDPRSCLLSGAGLRFVARLAAEVVAIDERAVADKARYLRQASHQVKSPLSSIQSYVNVILGGYTGEIPERTRDVVQKIHGRCDAALAALAKRRMLADLRGVRREDLATSPVHIGEAVNDAAARFAEAADGRGLEIRVLPGSGPDLVDADPVQLPALVCELLENAVVYSRDGGLVEIAVESRPDGAVTLAVRDEGIGIPERCLPRIFDEDYRADVAVAHHQDGAGLGLAVAREIAGLHGFDLAVQSEEGHGSLFTVIMPAAQE